MAGGDVTPIPLRPPGWSRRWILTTRFRARQRPVVALIRYTIAGDFNGERSDGGGT
jgi:hypothetical protein